MHVEGQTLQHMMIFEKISEQPRKMSLDTNLAENQLKVNALRIEVVSKTGMIRARVRFGSKVWSERLPEIPFLCFWLSDLVGILA